MLGRPQLGPGPSTVSEPGRTALEPRRSHVRCRSYLSVVAVADSDLPLAEALRQEYWTLQAHVEQSRERAERLRELAEQAEEQVAGEEKLLRDLAGVLGLSAQTSMDDLDGRLRVQRLREVAVQVLQEWHGVGEPIHYRAWFNLVREHGYAVGGKDPLATFLAQVSRAEHVEPVGKRSGLYLLRAA